MLFNELVPAADSITEELLATSNLRQHTLCSKIEDQQFRLLFDLSSPAHRARLLSVSSRHAASWLTVIPSPGLNLHLEPNEFQVAIKWWLGMDVSFGSCCPYCPNHMQAGPDWSPCIDVQTRRWCGLASQQPSPPPPHHHHPFQCLYILSLDTTVNITLSQHACSKCCNRVTGLHEELNLLITT